MRGVWAADDRACTHTLYRHESQYGNYGICGPPGHLPLMTAAPNSFSDDVSIQLERRMKKRLHRGDGSVGRSRVIAEMRAEFDARIGVREGLPRFRIHDFA